MYGKGYTNTRARVPIGENIDDPTGESIEAVDRVPQSQP